MKAGERDDLTDEDSEGDSDPSIAELRRGATVNDDEVVPSVDEVGRTLLCLGGRYVQPGERDLRLSIQDKMHCVVLGLADCLQRCSDIHVSLPEISHLEQEALEHDINKDLLQKSPYPLLSVDEQMVFQTTMLEGMSSKFGLKPDRRESLLKWLCRVARILQHNKVQWAKCPLLLIALDPYHIVTEHASWMKGIDIYSSLRNCKAIRAQVGVVGRSNAVVAAVDAADSNIRQLEQKIKVIRSEKQQLLLYGDKQGKKNKKK